MWAYFARSRYFHWRWPDDAYLPKSLRHVRIVLLPFDNYEAYADRCQTTWCSRSSWRWCFPGLTMAPQLLPAFWSNSWTGFSLCRTPLHDWSSKLVVGTTFSRYCVDYTGFGCQNVLLHRSGTVCRSTAHGLSRSGRLRRCKFSAADWKPNFLPGLTVMTNNVSLHWLLLRDFTV